MRLSGQLPYCSAPLVHDTYSGCDGECLYCFSKNRTGTKGVLAREEVKPARGNKLDNMPRAALDAMGLAVHVGSLHGTLPEAENQHYSTQRFLEDWLPHRPVILSTKKNVGRFDGVVRAAAKHAGRFLLQVSICSDSSTLLGELEGLGVPGFEERLEGLQHAAASGLTTVVRLQPFVGAWWTGLAPALRRMQASGVRGVVVEHLKTGAGSTRWRELIEFMDRRWRVSDKVLVKQGGQDRSAPLQLRISNYLTVAEACHEAGMHCFAADNDIRALGDSPHCCGQELMEE
jgi:DNA repair photolyase